MVCLVMDCFFCVLKMAQKTQSGPSVSNTLVNDTSQYSLSLYPLVFSY